MHGSDGPLYFQIGFHRCGTSALATFFDRCGIPCVHYDNGRLGRRMLDNLASGRAPVAGYERFRAFANIQFSDEMDYFDGFRHFAALDAAYDARFILNTRPRERWIASLAAHNRRRPGARAHLRMRFGTADAQRVADGWRALWDEHYRRVVAELPPERLLVFDIESDPPERLCEFVGVPRACARHYRLENPSLNRLGLVLAACVPMAAKRALPERFKLPVKKLFGVRVR